MPPKKRAASPVNDAVPRKTRSKKGKTNPATQPISDDDVQPKKPAKRGRAAAKVKYPSDDEDNREDSGDARSPPEAKAKLKTDAIEIDDGPADGQSDAQYAKAKDNLLIPVDEECPLANHRVYIDDSDGIIYDASLNQTNAGNNNNKFYRVQLLTNGKEFKTWTRWGRVGERGQNKLLGDGTLQDGLVNFNKKFKEKSGLSWEDRGKTPKNGKYVFIERSYEPDSDKEDDEEEDAVPSGSKEGRSRSTSPAKSSLAPPVKSLMELIFNQQFMDYVMADLNYDAAKLPLGKLSKMTITRGYQALKDLSALLDDPSLAQTEYDSDVPAAIEQLSNRYYSYIPHAFGRNKPPVIRSPEGVKKEVELLESLTDLKDADSIIKSEKGASYIHPLDARYNGLGMREVTPVARQTEEFNHINDYLTKTCGQTHGLTYNVLDIFRIERQGETERFQALASVASDRRLLWHGSRSTNYGGILSQGLRIAPPEAPVSGYMFGKGIYLADMSSKSANYCCSYTSDGHALLLLCEAELGNPMQELTGASYSAGDDAKAKGMYSTWGKGMTGPQGWKDAGCIHPSLAGVKMPDTTNPPGHTSVPSAYLMYNEYIVYDVAQVRLRYLLRVKM